MAPASSAAIPAALLLGVALAGCVEQAPQPGGPAPPELAPALWERDCAISNWGDACTAKATVELGPANEVMAAANPRDPLNLVVGSKNYHPEGSDCVWAGVLVTKDGGSTWENLWVGGPKARREPRLAAFDCVTDPVLEFGADGTLYYLVEAYNIGEDASEGLPQPLGGMGAGSTMFLAASLDGGLSWELRGVITTGPGAFLLLHDKSDLAVSPVTGTIAASWTAFGFVPPGVFLAELLHTRSTDGGRTFAPAKPLMSLEAERDAVAMVDLEWDAEGRLHAVWFNWDTGAVLYALSEDDGASFGAPRVLAQAHPWRGEDAPNSRFRIFDSPMLAVDRTEGPRRGWLYLTWADDRAREGDHDVWFMRSEDGGATWSEPVVLSGHEGSDEFHPNLVVADDGSLHLFYYDRHYNPGNRFLDATHALTLDGGSTWSFTRLSAGSFDGDLGIHQGGFPFMGDYNGIAAAGPIVYMAYADTREGRSDVAVAKVVRA